MPELLSRDPAFLAFLEIAGRAARSHANVLLTGESGSGKNHLARWIHERSLRSAGPLVEVHCANLPPDLVEAELFGHEEGAFTGAAATRVGRFEQADGGTLYLDEIQELDAEVQAKVLRAVQEKVFERVGSGTPRRVDVRIVASTRESPETLVASGRLRQDLFYRLDVVRLAVPPLRDRAGDARLLAEVFAREEAARQGRLARPLSAGALETIEGYDWPGNVRELKNAVAAAVVLSEGPEIERTDLPASLGAASPGRLRAAAARGLTLAEVENAYIDEVLARVRGNKSAAARILGIHRKTLHEKLRARRARADGA